MRSYMTLAAPLTVIIWLMAAMLMMGPPIDDCLPEMGHSCPTDHERKFSVMWIAFTAAAINVASVWLLTCSPELAPFLSRVRFSRRRTNEAQQVQR